MTFLKLSSTFFNERSSCATFAKSKRPHPLAKHHTPRPRVAEAQQRPNNRSAHLPTEENARTCIFFS
jgi:hypothetical protein